MVESLVQDIKRMGEIEYMVLEAFEKSNELFKDQYRNTSKCKSTAMYETVILQDEYSGSSSIAAREVIWKMSSEMFESEFSG